MVKDHKVLENQNIFDVANITLGGFDNIYVGLIQQNENITSIDFDLNSIATENIKFDDLYFSSSTIQIQLNVPNQSTIKEYVRLENQSIYDVALMKYGSLESIYELIQKNNLISINELSVAFKNLIFEDTKVVNLSLVKNINKKAYVFGTLQESDGNWILSTGYWRDLAIWIDTKTWID